MPFWNNFDYPSIHLNALFADNMAYIVQFLLPKMTSWHKTDFLLFTVGSSLIEIEFQAD